MSAGQARTFAAAESVPQPISSTQELRNADGTLQSGVYLAQLNGLAAWFKISGSGPLLIVPTPGWGCGAELYEHTLQPLEARNTVLYLETRGSGRSASPPALHELHSAYMAADLEALRLLLGEDQLRIFGHSGGGRLGLQYALQFPGCTSELNLVCTTAVMDHVYRQEVAANFTSKESFYPEFKGSTERYQYLLSRGTDNDFREAVAAVLPLYFDDPQRAALLPLLSGSDARFNFRTFRAFNKFNTMDYRPNLAAVQCPTRIFAGRADCVCPASQALALQQSIPGAQLKIYKHTGHFPWLEAAAEFFAEF